MKKLSARHVAKQQSSFDPLASEFCRIFHKDMDRLYLLSLLLTADPQLAEDCFVRGLEDAIKSNGAFKEWAQAWARRMIIQNAIHMIQPQPTVAREAGASPVDEATTPARIAAILALPAFERFTFVLSVLERYSDQDCALLLGSTSAEVTAARTRALQHIAESAELERQLSLASDERAQQRNRRSEIQHNSVLQRTASV